MSRRMARFLAHPWIDAVLGWRGLWGALALAWMAFLFWTSHRSWEQETSNLPAGLGNVLHFFLYGLLGGQLTLAGGGWSATTLAAFRRIGIRAVLFASLFGACDEIHQHFVAGRTCSVFDLVVDGHGAAFAALSLAGLRGWAPPGGRLPITLFAVFAAAMAFALLVPSWFPPWDDL